MCSCFAFPATIYPAAEHSRALFNNTHGTLVCVMFRNVCVHFDFLACMLRARRVLPGQSGGSVGGSVPTSAMFYLPACTWVTCNSYTKRTQLPSAHPKGKTNPHCVLPQTFGYLSAFTCRALHTLFGVGTILLCLSGGFHVVLAIACLDLHTHVPRDPPLVCLQSAGLLGGIQTVLLRFLLALCAT